MRLNMLVLALPALLCSCAGDANSEVARPPGIPTECTITKLQPKGAEKIVLPYVELVVVQPDGRSVSVPVEVCGTYYRCIYQEVSGLGRKDRAFDRYCYEVRSKDSKKPFHWYLWSDFALGRFHIWPTDTGRSYLTSISGFVILGDEVGKTQDRATSFSDWVVMKKLTTKQFFVPVAELVGYQSLPPSGMVDGNAVIDVLSLAETADGIFTIQFRPANSSKVYTAKSDPSAKLKWRIVEWGTVSSSGNRA